MNSDPELNLSAVQFATSDFAVGPIPQTIEPVPTGPARNRRTPRRRVLHVINGEHYSGAERVQDLLASCLPEFGYEIGFACVKPKSFADARVYKEAPIHDGSMKSRLDLSVVARLAAIVRDENYELIHAHTPRSAMIARLLSMKTGRPMVFHVHSPTARDSTRLFQNRINNVIERLSLTNIARLITVSESLAKHMIRAGYDADRIVVVPNGVPTLKTVPQRQTPKSTWTLGTVALFRPRKGTEVLLEAISILRRRDIVVSLRAVGTFESLEYEKHLKSTADRFGIAEVVTWTGFRRDVIAELARMDLFVLPSLFGEGLPMVVLEAMSSGLPVVGTDVEGVPEAVRDGLDGMIARAGDANSLADSIESIVRGEYDWSTLGRNALDRQVSQFSDRSMARGVADVYDDLLGPTAETSSSTPTAVANGVR